jgi:hypothetical protein
MTACCQAASAEKEMVEIAEISAEDLDKIQLALVELKSRGVNSGGYTIHLYKVNGIYGVLFRDSKRWTKHELDSGFEPKDSIEVVLSADGTRVIKSYVAKH